MLHRSNLVVSDVPGQGPELRRRGDERKRKEFTAKLTNILAIRFKGIDPDSDTYLDVSLAELVVLVVGHCDLLSF